MSTGSATRPVHTPVVQLKSGETQARANQAGGGPPGRKSGEPPISNAKMGMLMLIGAETMFFAGLIGAYLVFRFGTTVWPSAHLYLPVAVTWANSVVLASSCYTMYKATNCFKSADFEAFLSFLCFTVCLGTIFLCVQGYEWIQLVHDGLTISAGMYGATFYVLIGCHALHVLAAVVWLAVVLFRARHGQYSQERYTGIETCSMYWYYVGAVWLVLFPLVYLN